MIQEVSTIVLSLYSGIHDLCTVYTTPYNSNGSHTWILEREFFPLEFAQENPWENNNFHSPVIALSGPNKLLCTIIK